MLFALTYGLWVWLPFMAPVFMHAGLVGAGRALYIFYSVFCHQLPERSFFLFGPRLMYSLSTIQAAGFNTINPFLLRQFVGSSSMGWKVAWSDRMISFYSGIWIFAVFWYAFRRASKPMPWYVMLLFLVPILLDGGTHAISDLAGLGRGFRDSNAWLAALTLRVFPTSFYVGDALGSFNSIMRLVTGLLAALGITWFAFPYVEASFGEG